VWAYSESMVRGLARKTEHSQNKDIPVYKDCLFGDILDNTIQRVLPVPVLGRNHL
jgi:hypothetical protein